MKPSECGQMTNAPLIKDDNLLNLFRELQNSNTETRLKASNKLVIIILELQNQLGREEISSGLEYTFSRLIQGLGSSRKLIKVSFSTALTNLLKNIPSTLMSSKRFLYLINDQLSCSGQHLSRKTVKEVYVGQLFCLLSLIRSHKLLDDNDDESVIATVEAILKLSRKNPNLKMLCYHAIQELVVQADDDCFNNGIWTSLFPILRIGWSQCTVEVLLLLLVCSKHHPVTCGKKFLKTFKWIENDSSDILSKPKFAFLAQLIAKTTYCHPTIHQSVIEVVTLIGQQSSGNFCDFWTNSLEKVLFASSPEKKYLALSVAVHVLSFISSQHVSLIWSKKVIGYLLHALSQKHCSIHLLCQKNLLPILAKKFMEKTIASEVQYTFVVHLFTSVLDVSLDNTLCTMLMESVVEHLELKVLGRYITWLRHIFLKGNDHARKSSCCQFVQLVKFTTVQQHEDWTSDILKLLFFHSHCTVVSHKEAAMMKEVDEVDDNFVSVSAGIQEYINRCFIRVMTTLIERLPSDHKKETLGLGMKSSGELWMTYLLNFADSILSSKNVEFIVEWDEPTQETWRTSLRNLNRLSTLKDAQADVIADGRVLDLLLSCVAFQLFSVESNVRKISVDVIDDLEVIMEERFPTNEDHSPISTNTDSPYWVEVVIEIILSLLLSESSIVRSTVEQAFRILSPLLTTKALQLLLDVLRAKDEGELMECDVNGDDAHEGMDNEQDPDDSSDDEDDQSDDRDDHTDNEVDDQFRFEIRKALGNATGPLDELSDASDSNEEKELNDEDMMKLDPILSEIFKRRKKPDSSATKKHMFEFQARCLLLIDIFISRRHDNSFLILDLPLPLLSVIEQASVDQRKACIANRASILLRVKLCQMKNLPSNLDADAISSCYDNIAKILSMIVKGSRGVFMNQLMSHCCMFYVRILSRQKKVDSSKICSLYLPVLHDFMLRRQSKVQQFVLHDFVHNYPEISHDLAVELIKYCRKAVQPYRRIIDNLVDVLQLQACLLLSSLFQSKSSHDYMAILSPSLLKNLEKILTSITREASKVNSKGLLQFIKLLHFPVKCLRKKSEQYDWSKLTGILQSLLGTPVAARSSKILSHLWKVLQLLGVSRPQTEKNKKRLKAQQGDMSVEAVADEKVTEKESTEKESTRQLKRRIMKEKKKGAGKGKKAKVKTLITNKVDDDKRSQTSNLNF